jgi:predicted flap endonuclease-1-like 5' DNA nuclease
MKFKILELRGVGPQNAKALEKADLYYADELLDIDVAAVSKKTGLKAADIQRWKDYVLLMKIRTVGPAYANLLHREDVGITTVGQLAQAKPADVLEKLKKSNSRRRIVKVLPTLKKVENWIQIAKSK